MGKINAADVPRKVTKFKETEIWKTMVPHTVSINSIGSSDSCTHENKTGGVSKMMSIDSVVRVCTNNAEEKTKR